MLRMGKMYSSNISVHHEAFFSLFAAERAALELWTELVQGRLTVELDRGVAELRNAMSTPRRRLEPQFKSRQLLVEYSDILAHKALVDARISVLSGEVLPTASDDHNSVLVASLVDSERYLWLLEECGEVSPMQQAEWTAVWTRCLDEAGAQAVPGLRDVEREVARLQGDASTALEPTTWIDVAARCKELQQRLAQIPSQACTQCQHLKDSIHRLSREHEASITVHETAQAQLRERTRQLEHRLGTLDSEYTRQLEQLRVAYRDTLTTPPGGLLDGTASDSLRARYQAEIEQLRALCEKGLAAVESSHRRVVAELQDKHRREREQLRLDKEQALAEETQATLAALDAMRKAHEHEVRREVAKFKSDFLRRLQATRDLGALHTEHESEMRDIKQEILALSERYSVKCVESAGLEEQLGAVQQQLATAQRRIHQLDTRNKQLAESLATLANDEQPYHRQQQQQQQDRVPRRGSSGMDGCKPKINTIRNPQLSPMQN